MSASFLKYYQRELTTLKTSAYDFAKRYPNIADRLSLDTQTIDDPEVAHLVQSVAFLSAKQLRQLDYDRQEYARGILQQLAPDLLVDIPPVAMVQFHAENELSQSIALNKCDTIMARSADENAVPLMLLRPISIAPFAIEKVEVLSKNESQSYLALTLSKPKERGDISGLLDSITLYLQGDFRHCSVLLSELLKLKTLSLSNKKPELSTFSSFDVSMAPLVDGIYADDGVAGFFDVLTEYAVFPEKNHFVTLSGINGLDSDQDSNVVLYLPLDCKAQLVQECLDHVRLQLNVVPVCNAFAVKTDPFRVDHEKIENRIPSQNPIYCVSQIEGWQQSGESLHFVNHAQECARYSSCSGIRYSTKPSFFNDDVALVFSYEKSENEQALSPWMLSVHAMAYSKKRLSPLSLEVPRSKRYSVSWSKKLSQPIIKKYCDDDLWFVVRLLLQLRKQQVALLSLDMLKAMLHFFNDCCDAAFTVLIDAMVKKEHVRAYRRVLKPEGLLVVMGQRVTLTFKDAFGDDGLFVLGCVLHELLNRSRELNEFVELCFVNESETWSRSWGSEGCHSA